MIISSATEKRSIREIKAASFMGQFISWIILSYMAKVIIYEGETQINKFLFVSVLLFLVQIIHVKIYVYGGFGKNYCDYYSSLDEKNRRLINFGSFVLVSIIAFISVIIFIS